MARALAFVFDSWPSRQRVTRCRPNWIIFASALLLQHRRGSTGPVWADRRAVEYTSRPGHSQPPVLFRQCLLELLWVHDSVEAQSEATAPTHLWNRLAGRDGETCPFGLCFRSIGNDSRALFPTWDYRPGYLPHSLSIGIGGNADVLEEPFLCYLTFGRDWTAIRSHADRRSDMPPACAKSRG